MFLPGFCVFAFVCVVHVSSAGLNEEFSWSRITFQWPQVNQLSSRSAYGLSRGERQKPQLQRPTNEDGGAGGRKGEGMSIVFESSTNAENQKTNTNNNQASSGPGLIDYQFANNIPMGANAWKDKLFITIPRRKPGLGVPSTVNYVPLNNPEKHNVPLIPYPSWDMNLYPDTSGNGENFVSVYRLAIDVCDRMWFVDTGIVETFENLTVVKPHQLVIINLQTDEVIHRFELPQNLLTPATILASLTIDASKESCEDAFAYIPDLLGYGVLVYSLRENRAWRVSHNYFFMEPMAGDFFIAGHNFQWNDGVFSVELSDIQSNGYRDMFFHSLAGTQMYKVSTRIMRNESLATRSIHDDDFTVIGDRGPNSQTSTADIHKPTGTMFLGLINQNAVGCWNTNNNLKTISIVQKDDDKMIYPSDVKISGDKVYVMTNTLPQFLYGKLDYDVINFRVWSNDIRRAIQGTRCQRGRRGGVGG